MPRFFTSACVTSRIMATFCSSVRPAAMLMVISGICSSPFVIRLVGPVGAGFNPASHHLKRWLHLKRWIRGSSPHQTNSVPRHAMSCQYFTHGRNEIVFIDLGLRFGLLLQIFVAIAGRGQSS